MGKSSPKKGAWKAEPLMAAARLEMQEINQGAREGVWRDARCWSPLFLANAAFAGGMKKIINFKKN